MRDRFRFLALLRLPVTVLVVLLGALGLAACGGDDDTALQEAEEEGTAEGLVGRTITVSGEVERVLSPQAFLIGGDFVSLGFDEGTLVFGRQVPAVNEGGRVQVTGVVHEFVVADIENEFGVTFDRTDDLIVEYEDEFAIAAQDVTFVPASGDLLERAEQEGTAARLVGDVVSVSGEVEKILSPQAFRLEGDEPGEGTLVLSAERARVTEGGVAQVRGTVVRFVIADVEREFDLDLDNRVFANVDDEYAIVAESVQFVPD